MFWDKVLKMPLREGDRFALRRPPFAHLVVLGPLVETGEKLAGCGRHDGSLVVLAGEGPDGVQRVEPHDCDELDFVADVVSVRVQIVEDDGVTPCAGIVTLIDHGWPFHVETDASGRATFTAVMRGEAVQVEFGRPTGTTPFGTPAYGARIPVGTLRAERGAEEVVLRLPAR